MKKQILALSAIAALALPIQAQSQEPINDSNTPLHLIQPNYKIKYGIPTQAEVKAKIDQVLSFITAGTPTRVIDKQTGAEIKDFNKLNQNAQLERGLFRIASYEWGVTYSAVLRAGEVTGDVNYKKYATDRFSFLNKVSPYFKQLMEKSHIIDPQMKQVLTPHALDDAGAVCAAMLKQQSADGQKILAPIIENYMDFVLNKEYHLADGTYARNRPQHNSVWLDDMFMAIPSIAQMYHYTGDTKYIDEAAHQVELFADKMWVPEMNLFRHGWVESMDTHPSFFWGRANGWAFLTLSEVLDVLPENHPKRAFVLNLFKKHAMGLAALQDGDGFWHQLLNKSDAYEETSATSIYTYCMAHGINKGWLDAKVYGPIVLRGWSATASKITAKGEVADVCVGTGMGFDPAYYYYRPVNTSAAHGYGPAIWAGAEVIEMLKHTHPKMNDSAVMFYTNEQKTQEPIFSAE